MKYVIATLFLCQIALAAVFSPDSSYQACFTPREHCRQDVVTAINNAKKSIEVQAYTFTSWKLADALVSAKKHGVDVRMILDQSNLQLPNANKKLMNYLKKYIPIWIDNKVSIAHNKVMIFDDAAVLTGSYNFTNAAEYYNAENIIIIHDKTLAQQYFTNWQNRQSQSYRLNPDLAAR